MTSLHVVVGNDKVADCSEGSHGIKNVAQKVCSVRIEQEENTSGKNHTYDIQNDNKLSKSIICKLIDIIGEAELDVRKLKKDSDGRQTGECEFGSIIILGICQISEDGKQLAKDFAASYSESAELPNGE